MAIYQGADRRMLLVACLGGGLSALDSSVNIAFPALIDAFRVDVSSLQWVVASYVLTYTALLLPFGRLADRLGHRTVLVNGLVVSTVALAACAAAPNFTVFLVARMAQGVGIALVLAAAPALVTLAVPPGDRARALSWFQMSIALGFAVGAPLGGLLLELTSWRSVFVFRVPVALAILGLATLGATVRSGGGRVADGPPRPLDLPGGITFATGLASLLFVASRGSTLGWTAPVTVGLAGLAVAALVGFVVAERRAPAPLVDLSLLRNPAFAVANALNAMANGTMFAIWLLAPTLLVTVQGHSATTGGALLAALALGTALAAPLAGRLVPRLGTGVLSTAGLAVEAVGLAAVSRLGVDSSAVTVAATFAVVGAGLGLFQVPNLNYVMGSISREQQGVAGGMAQMVRTTGVVVGTAVANAVFVARLEHRTGTRRVADLADVGGFVGPFRDVLLGAAAVCAVAAMLSFVRPDTADAPRARGQRRAVRSR